MNVWFVQGSVDCNAIPGTLATTVGDLVERAPKRVELSLEICRNARG